MQAYCLRPNHLLLVVETPQPTLVAGRKWFPGTEEEKAERVVAEELRRRSWTEPTLTERPKGDREKVKIAVRCRPETLVTATWIAGRLPMGSVANLNTLLYHWRPGRK